jgi:hypothetical protein
MYEHRAAAPRNARARIVVDLDDHVVEPIGSPQTIARLPRLEPDGAIVASIRRVFAPTVRRTDPPYRQ